ncbi:MAG: tryptophan synthase subunit alpha [Methylococcales bacterium]|nr:tryptophan synthase subunit alpha [Methylococcales bacterium]
MSRLAAKFRALKKINRCALIPFITVGDPNPEFTVPLMHAMVEVGVDIIELGVPFSDPMADGPVIQRASERALAHKIGLRNVLDIVKVFRKTDQKTPVVLMGYLNPIEILGYQNFTDKAYDADIDGVLTVDLPPEEAKACSDLLNEKNIDTIFLLAPNSTPERVKKMDAIGRGYLYYVSVKGVTGAGHLNITDVDQKLTMIKQHTNLPMAVGFGVKTAKTAQMIAQRADAVVVGSALIEKIENNLENPEQAKEEIIELLHAMRQAMDR